jgi:hypothetical protein
MSARIRHHIRSNVIGYLALFVALGGTAYATHPGGANTISSGDIIDGQVMNPDIGANAVGTGKIIDDTIRSADIGTDAVNSAEITSGAVRTAEIQNGQVLSADVANNSLTGADVADTDSLGSPEIGELGGGDVTDDSLTGTDVQESSLLGVNADKVDGGDLCRTGGVVTLTGTGVNTVCEQGALRVDAVCIQLSGTAANATLRITTSVDDSFYGERGDSPSQDGDFDAADGGVGLTSSTDSSMADPGVASQPASFYAGTAAGAQLSGTAGTRATLNGDGSATCNFVVGAIG